MQLVFQRSAALRPVARVGAARRGAFALEPVGALPRLAERVERLAERALEPNPFFLPAFLEPAIQALGGRNLRLATFSDRDDLRFFAPVLLTGGRLLGRPKLSIWTHAYAPLGSPLIDGAMADAAGDSLLQYMRNSGRTLMSVPLLPLQGAAAAALVAAATRHGFATMAARQMRPILRPGDLDGPAAFDDMVTQKRRRELDRQLRRLCDTDSVSFMSAHTPSEIAMALNIFITLEASGWKGRRGTALQRRRKILDFARTAVMRLAQQGQATIDVMRIGDKPLAALIRLDHGGLSIPWKIAYDESFAAYSPGKQLMCDETRRWLQDANTLRVDPVCEEDNPLMAGLWSEREPYGTLIVTSRRWGIAARMRAGIINARSASRRGAKSLLVRKRRPVKPRSAKAR